MVAPPGVFEHALIISGGRHRLAGLQTEGAHHAVLIGIPDTDPPAPLRQLPQGLEIAARVDQCRGNTLARQLIDKAIDRVALADAAQIDEQPTRTAHCPIGGNMNRIHRWQRQQGGDGRRLGKRPGWITGCAVETPQGHQRAHCWVEVAATRHAECARLFDHLCQIVRNHGAGAARQGGIELGELAVAERPGIPAEALQPHLTVIDRAHRTVRRHAVDADLHQRPHRIDLGLHRIGRPSAAGQHQRKDQPPYGPSARHPHHEAPVGQA